MLEKLDCGQVRTTEETQKFASDGCKSVLPDELGFLCLFLCNSDSFLPL